MPNNNNQFSLFDSAAAREAKREGMDRVDKGADARWKAAMAAAIVVTARKLQKFSADDIYMTFWEKNVEGAPTTRDDRALGPLMSAAARDRICVPTDEWIKTKRASRHNTDIRVWRSLIFNQGVTL